MQLFYTNSNEPGGLQSNPAKSLGGYVSSSPFPSGGMNLLFGEVSYNMLSQKPYEVRGLALMNTTGQKIINPRFYFDHLTTDRFTKLEVAFVTLLGNEEFEKIPNGKSLPVQISGWIEPEGVGNEVQITSEIDINSGVGVWFRRTFISPMITIQTPSDGSPSTDYEFISEIPKEDLKGFWSNITASEEINLVISWN